MMSAAEQFARAVNESAHECERLQRGVELVAELVPGCHHVGAAIRDKRGLRPWAWTDEVGPGSIARQMAAQEGPSLDSLHSACSVASNDVESDRRWPIWGRQAARELGVRTAAAFVLTGYDQQGRAQSLGTLTLYSDDVDAFDDVRMRLAHELSTHLAIALAASREIRQRGDAMESRTVIGQAIGILMERFALDPDRAFGVLQRLSQTNNRRIVDLATEPVTTRDLSCLHAGANARATVPTS